MKKYSGQAIAIIMVILVVAAVIGASLYSRMIRNKGEVIDTRESSKALEQSGNILDAFITTDIRTLQDGLYEELTNAGGKITIEATSLDDLTGGIEGYFGEIGLELELEELTMDASCSNYKMSFEFAPPSEGPEYNVGDVMAINLSNVTPPENCEVSLNFPQYGEKIFTVKEVYSDGGVGYKPYELAHMKVYCLLQGSDNCAGMSPTTSFENWSKPTLTYDIHSLKEEGLVELRVMPLKGTIEIGVSSVGCDNIFDQFLIKATSICSGQERTMQVIIPSATNYGYDPMFDYTIYNSNGALAPVVIP